MADETKKADESKKSDEPKAAKAAEVPQYQAKSKGHCGKQVREKGEKFPYAGKPGKWMEPLNESAKKAVAAYEAEKKAAKEGVASPKK